MKQNERVDLIMAYEGGDLDEKGCLELFSHLIETGMCWRLQGSYGRMAMSLIENEVISKTGKILV